MIFLNSVYKYVDINDGERIRIISIHEDSVYIVNIDANTSMPQKVLISKIQDEIEQQKLIRIKDPFSRTIKDSELSKIQIQKRNEQWSFIEKYWEVNISEILNKSTRNQRLSEISDEAGISISKVKKIFSRYWQRGMSKNSLLPDYINSGGKGKEKKLAENKIGRPKKVDYHGEVKEGINITDDVKKQFEYGINKYYMNTTKVNLKEVYTLILRDFYSEKVKDDSGEGYVLWDEGAIPSYQQFYYWYRKNQNIKKK